MKKLSYLLTSVQFYNYKQMLRLFSVAKILTCRLAGFDINGCPIAGASEMRLPAS